MELDKNNALAKKRPAFLSIDGAEILARDLGNKMDEIRKENKRLHEENKMLHMKLKHVTSLMRRP